MNCYNSFKWKKNNGKCFGILIWYFFLLALRGGLCGNMVIKKIHSWSKNLFSLYYGLFIFNLRRFVAKCRLVKTILLPNVTNNENNPSTIKCIIDSISVSFVSPLFKPKNIIKLESFYAFKPY